MEDRELKEFINGVVDRQGNAIAERLENSMASVAERAATKVLGTWGQIVGYDLSDPKDIQRMQGDFSSMRRFHDRERAVGSWLGKAVVMAVVAVLITAAGLGIKVLAGSPPNIGGPFK